MAKTNYPVGDFLIRLKNASLSGNKRFELGTTKFIGELANTLEKMGFIKVDKGSEKGKLAVVLTYVFRKPLLTNVEIVSRPGRRVYWRVDEIQKHKGPSVLVISTPRGILTGAEAIKKNLGGEVIAKIY